jgi:hypothetical protein
MRESLSVFALQVYQNPPPPPALPQEPHGSSANLAIGLNDDAISGRIRSINMALI